MGRTGNVSDKPEALALKDWVSEKFLQNQIIDYLNEATQGYFWQNDSFHVAGRKRHNRFRPNGVPDILGLIDGMSIGIEVKSPKGKILQSQIEFSQRFRRSGGSYYVIRSMEDLTELCKVNGWV
jgi:hypothetical protein